jgi:hypothetical protein
MANTTGQKFGGRTKGTSNKTTTELREKFSLLIENNFDKKKPREYFRGFFLNKQLYYLFFHSFIKENNTSNYQKNKYRIKVINDIICITDI